MSNRISILWNDSQSVSGEITLTNAGVCKLRSGGDNGLTEGNAFRLDANKRLELEIDDSMTDIGPFPTVVNVRTKINPFSFFLRDVRMTNPIFIEQYGVVVTEAHDGRSYGQIVSSVFKQGNLSKLQLIESQPEESFDNAAKQTHDLKCLTWLGLSRDIRNFEINLFDMKDHTDICDSVQPKYHGVTVLIPELGDNPLLYNYTCGRGYSCVLERKRWLEKDVLPILNVCLDDEEIQYHYKIFVTLEKSPLAVENVKGTHFLVANKYSLTSMFTDEQKKRIEALHDDEIYRDEETVCYIRVQAVNTGKTPKYSFVRLPQPRFFGSFDRFGDPMHLPQKGRDALRYDAVNGMGGFGDDRVFLIATVNGKPVPDIEMSVLLAPGEKAEYIYKIPHTPVSALRAKELAAVSFDEKLHECVRYWEKKLSRMAPVKLPEKRIDNMMKAGFLHCDIVAYGNEPDGAIAPTVGVYSPIGSESAPIIQYMDSMGYHDFARRAIMYFIEKQHDDGFMQNYGGYMLETGCVLWTIGEHWRYTRDAGWISSIRENIVKAAEYITAWRNRNKREELRGRGYGMIEGKVADVEDNCHFFMLNSTAYVGMKRAGELLAVIGDGRAQSIIDETRSYLADIMESLNMAYAEAPAIPLGNGAWCPSMPVWTENPGSLCLHTTGGNWSLGGTTVGRDSLVSTQYLLLDEIIEPDHHYADFILNCMADTFMRNNTAFAQPYYSVHPYANLRRGEVKAFLKEFYNNASSLGDRETYTFWEGYNYCSPHKTHEEGWFLMRCRWMLYLEADEDLTILPGVPRKWLANGNEIEINEAASYFGHVGFNVVSRVSERKITVYVKLKPIHRLPERLIVRIPHPDGIKAGSVSAGVYDAGNETVIIDGFKGEIGFTVYF